MTELMAIGWAVWFVVAIATVYATVGNCGLTNMFPEAKRWWHTPTEFVALIFFGIGVLQNPWITWSMK